MVRGALYQTKGWLGYIVWMDPNHRLYKLFLVASVEGSERQCKRENARVSGSARETMRE